MANPYKKAEEVRKKSPGGLHREEPVAPVAQEKIEPAVEPVTAEAKTNPLAGMIETKPEGKSYGFYLSNEAIAKLEKLAKQNKCSKSKALDTLLRSIL